MRKVLLWAAFFICSIHALEFGYMGNRSFGMGGSGVAVSNSPWSLYYNPSLQGIDSSIKFGVSSGFRLNLPNIGDIFTSMDDIFTKINDISVVFKNTTETGLAVQVPIPLITNMTSSVGFGAFYTTRSLVGISSGDIINNTNAPSNDSVNVNINSLSILELPVSYALGFSTLIGDFYLGVAGKYMLSNHNITTHATENPIKLLFIGDVIRPRGVSTGVFGVDVGIAYNAPFSVMTIGVVGKNLNQPSVSLKNGGHLKLESQYRFGISTNFIPLTTIALDVDLKPNNQFSYMDSVKHTVLADKTQMISLGGMVSIGFFDIRAGIAKDFFSTRDDLLISGGIGFTIIDISLYASTKTYNFGDIKLPSNFGIKIGGGFSF